uniref:LacI family transcriptional regulator n=1 Tax=Thermosporothrix sp. COM3 TaxID=2490863 RepID=A0A455SNP7_9CHLR|nr:LacI family transcriptional regulator [Thermosporothrix sp. COM3]
MTRNVPTLRDVARQAGVSIATVSYVLNGKRPDNKTINEETREKVLQAVAKLGYVPNQTARHLRRQRTERICIVLPQLGVPYYEALCQDIERIAEQHHYSVVLLLAENAEGQQKAFTQLSRQLADGVVFIHGSPSNAELEQLARAGIAVVAFNNEVEGTAFDIVRTTEKEAFYRAVWYLIDKGHRRIAFLYGGKENQADKDVRLEQYLQALRDANIMPDPRLILQGVAGTRKEAYRSAYQLLQQPYRPSAIFTGSDISAISTIWAARDLGLRVPDDVAVVGAGNIADGEITSPPLTTVGPASLDFTIIAKLLFDRLEHPGSQGRIHLCRWELIIRGSA